MGKGEIRETKGLVNSVVDYFDRIVVCDQLDALLLRFLLAM